MHVTNIRFRDLVTFLAISGILLLTAARYVEKSTCRCSVNSRTPFPAGASRDEVERSLRSVLRDDRVLTAIQSVPLAEDNHDGPR